MTVIRDAVGRWFVSMLCDDPGVMPLAATDVAVGIDLGLEHLVTLSTGEKITNPRHERRDRERLAKAQKDLARKIPRSKNREKARRKVARPYARITDRRRDVLHKLTTRLVVDRWFPSSKLCSSCGALRATMPVNIRSWTCECGTDYDRDVNAAKNLLAAGPGGRGLWSRCQTSTEFSGRAVGVEAEIPRREPWGSYFWRGDVIPGTE